MEGYRSAIETFPKLWLYVGVIYYSWCFRCTEVQERARADVSHRRGPLMLSLHWTALGRASNDQTAPAADHGRSIYAHRNRRQAFCFSYFYPKHRSLHYKSRKTDSQSDIRGGGDLLHHGYCTNGRASCPQEGSGPGKYRRSRRRTIKIARKHCGWSASVSPTAIAHQNYMC